MSFISDATITIEALERYYGESKRGDKPVIALQSIETIVRDLDLASFITEGGLTGERLRTFLDTYLSTTTRLHHPAYMAHQVAIPHSTGALGSLVDGFTNNAMAIYEMGPGASSIEYFLINWLLEKVGWTPAPLRPLEMTSGCGGGVLTHGGSLANLTALVAARNRAVPDAWENGCPNDLALLAPEGCHYSISRSAGVLGIGRNSIFPLAVDANGAVIPDRLPAALKRVTDTGKRTVALVANACSTAVGRYDPLHEIGPFCRENNIWLHVDGAHGASALFSTKHRHLLRGIDLADSLTWDAHKLLRTPALCAAILVRDHLTLDTAFEHDASYLFHDKVQPGFDFLHRTFECTKSGLGLKFFLVVAAAGEQALTEYVERQHDLARQAHEYIDSQPDFECPVEPQSNILCFRLTGSSDAQQLLIRDRLTVDGRFYISTTSFRGARFLRLVLMNPDTGMEEIAALIETIRTVYTKLD
jgi:L-2,4-diaminobutyrate decarboxylase